MSRLSDIAIRLEELRTELRAERISYGELAELQSLAAYIEPGDVELLQWAGVPEEAAGCVTCRNGTAIPESEPIHEDEHGKHRVCPACGGSANIIDPPERDTITTDLRNREES